MLPRFMYNIFRERKCLNKKNDKFITSVCVCMILIYLNYIYVASITIISKPC